MAEAKPGYDPSNVGQNSLPKLQGPGSGNPYGASDFLGTSNENDSAVHANDRKRIRQAILVKGYSVPDEVTGLEDIGQESPHETPHEVG